MKQAQLDEAKELHLQETSTSAFAELRQSEVVKKLGKLQDRAKSIGNWFVGHLCSAKHKSLCVTPPVKDMTTSVYSNSGKLHGEWERDWQNKFLTIEHQNCRHLGKPPNTASSICLISGFCWHTTHGRLLINFELMLVKTLKQLCPPSSLARQLLQHNFIVLRIWDGAQNHWFHVSFCNFRDWRLALLPMMENRSSFTSKWKVPLTVSGDGRWESTWTCFKDYTFSTAHVLQLWLLCAGKKNLGEHLSASESIC